MTSCVKERVNRGLITFLRWVVLFLEIESSLGIRGARKSPRGSLGSKGAWFRKGEFSDPREKHYYRAAERGKYTSHEHDLTGSTEALATCSEGADR